MTQLRQLAEHKSEFDQLNVRIVAISVDDREHAHLVWEKSGAGKIQVLSDPGAKVIQRYGLLHKGGAHDGSDIAIRSSVFVDEQGKIRWRRVSDAVPDIPLPTELLDRIRKTDSQPSKEGS